MPDLVIIMINICSFFLMGYDKYLAIKRRYRISEFKLLILPFLGGAPGAYLAMHFFNHKRKHPKFKYGLPLLIILNIYQIYMVNIYFVKIFDFFKFGV
ncbi:MAG: DUF1294 domain-containing protein [Peptococcaceae bacterium]